MASRYSFKENLGGLNVIQAVYAFAMALGLREVFLGSRNFLINAVFGVETVSYLRFFLMALLLLNIMLLGLRFFWVPRNLRGLIFTAFKHRPDRTRPIEEIPLSNVEVAFHLVVIFLHGTIFYFLCVEFDYVAFVSSSSAPLSTLTFAGYIFLHVSLLLVNALWIAMIQGRENRLREGQKGGRNSSATAGNVWWRNNLVCAMLAFAPVSVFATCGNAAQSCMRRATGADIDIFSLTPLAADQIYSVLTSLLSPFQLSSTETAVALLCVSLLMLLLNSILDLTSTGGTYLLFEEVEYSSTQDAETNPVAVDHTEAVSKNIKDTSDGAA